MASGRSLSVRTDTLSVAGGVQPAFGAADARSRVLLLQLVTLASEDLGVQGLRAEISGFAGAEVADRPALAPDREGDRVQGNLLVGLLRYASPRNTLSLTLGRQYLFAGSGRAEHLDGLSCTYRTPWHLDLTVFGGRTSPWQLDPEVVQPQDDERWYLSGYAVGGRLRTSVLEHAVASIGFLHEGHDTQTVRQDLTFDLGYFRSRLLEVTTGGIVEITVPAPQEIWVQLISRPTNGLKISADYSYLVPSLAIPRTSIFSVFADDVSYHDASLGVYYGLTPWLTAGVSGGIRLYPDVGDGLQPGYTAGAELRLTAGAARLAGLEVELVDAVTERQLQNRLFGLYRFGFGLYTSADLYLLLYDLDRDASPSVFGQRRDEHPISVGGVGVLGYRITPRLSAQLAGSAFTTAAAQYDLRLMARLTFDGRWGNL